MGIERSLKALERAQLVLLVLDAERGLDAEDEALLEMTAHKDRIILYNKKDRKEIPGALSVSALLGDIDDEGGRLVGAGGTWQVSVLSPPFF